MKKILVFLLFCLTGVSFCTAREYTVKLPAVPGNEQIFFLDLAGTGADSSTFTLTAPDGKKVPFSFDMQLVRSRNKGEYQSGVNGFYSKAQSPSSEKKFQVPGFLSFKGVPGVKEYIFKFKDGAKETVARPDPSVRGWWIEIMLDPYFKDPRYIQGKKGTFRMLPGGGVEFSHSLRVSPRGANIGPGISGRRIFALVRCKGPFTYFSIDLKNGAWEKTSAIACYFKPTLDKMQDICSEGLLASENVIPPRRRAFWRCEYVKGPSVVSELHVQLPPIGREMGASLASDLYNVGDTVTINSFGGTDESGIPFESGSIRGIRYGLWSGKLDLSFELKTTAGKTLLKGKGNRFTLEKVKPGTYELVIDIYQKGAFALRKNFPLKVQLSPF